MSGDVTLDNNEIQQLLLARAETLRRYIQNKIPQRFQSSLSAEDVLQEVWIAAFRAAPADIRNIDGWLTTLANSKLIDALRAVRTLKRGGGQRFDRDTAGKHTSFENLFQRVHAPEKTPSRELSAQEVRHAVRVALGRLPDDRRQAIQLRHIEGLSRKEIACAMKKTEAAINGLLFRGLNELRECLGDAAKSLSGVHPTGDVR